MLEAVAVAGVVLHHITLAQTQAVQAVAVLVETQQTEQVAALIQALAVVAVDQMGQVVLLAVLADQEY
jgi:hypothetical protein